MSPRAVLVSLLVTALAAAACTALNDREIVAPPAPPAPIHERWPGCLDVGAFRAMDAAPPDPGSVPSGFRPTTLIWCMSTELSTSPTDTPRGLERRSTSVDSMVEYLRRPSRRPAPGSDIACQAMAQLPPWLFLSDEGGRWITPRLPTDACGFYLDSLGDAAPPWSVLSYTDRVVCTFEQRGDRQICRR